MEGFFNKIYDNQSSNSSTIFEQDINKFTEIGGSPKSTNSRKSNFINKTFKQLLSENYSDYLSRIKAVL